LQVVAAAIDTDTDTDTLLKFKQQTCMNRQLTIVIEGAVVNGKTRRRNDEC